MLLKEDFDAWKSHPVTKEVLSFLTARRVEAMEMWANGNLAAETEFGTKFLNGQAIGACRVIQNILDLTVEDINGEMENEK